jgi:hypothetical protein
MSETETSKVEQAKKLKNDYEQLIQEVRDDLLGQIRRAISQLEEIGYKYSLQEAPDPQASVGNGPRQRSRITPTENFDAAKRCIVCDTIGHDGRAHRRQLRGRRPFTFDELARLGLCPPAVEGQVEGAA